LLFRALLDVLFPPLCLACKSPAPDAGEILLCAACREKIFSIQSPLCSICGLPFHTEQGMDHSCGGCITDPVAFTAARAAFVYDGTIKELIHRFKYGKKVYVSGPLALQASRCLAPFITASGAELIIPVPLHKQRLRQRGFNQAVLIAGVFAKAWRLPLSRNNLCRIRWTEPQIQLSFNDRSTNVRGAFAVNDPVQIKGRRLLLVDDVYTTGSTVAECAKILKKAGAGEIFVATIARAVIA
jgi:ComF family protein